jgi:hypothetical protein
MTTSIKHTTAVKVIVALAIGLLALGAPVAAASPAGEQQQGAQALSEVQAGKLKGTSLTSAQYEHVGQYLMGRALGSTRTYAAMDSLMDRMMGESAAGQMYRYLGKDVQPDSRSLPMYGWMASMMSAYRGATPYAGMMSRYLHGQGGRNGAYPMVGGAGMMGGYGVQGTSSSGGWPTAAIVLVAVLGGLLLGGALMFALPKLGRHHAGTPAARRT